MSDTTDSYRTSKRSLAGEETRYEGSYATDQSREQYRRRHGDEEMRSAHQTDDRYGDSDRRSGGGRRDDDSRGHRSYDDRSRDSYRSAGSYEERPRYDRDRRDAPRRDDRGGGGGGGGRSFEDEVPPQVSSIHHGRVVTIKPFGAFVELPGYRRHGLLHISQISTSRVERVEDALNPNDSVWVKVLSVDMQRKLSLSMKYIDQTTGADQDPDNSQQQSRGGRGGGGGGGGRGGGDYGGRGGGGDYGGSGDYAGRSSSSSSAYEPRSPSP